MHKVLPFEPCTRFDVVPHPGYDRQGFFLKFFHYLIRSLQRQLRPFSPVQFFVQRVDVSVESVVLTDEESLSNKLL